MGRKNIVLAFELLKKLGIPVITKSTGGRNGRIILFNTLNGEVIQRFVKQGCSNF
ncbi:MAG: hypothetical protein JW894_01585 [Bacteroidales bacterium]|nr:hypothetical protein [Bacteroidales bacterium]